MDALKGICQSCSLPLSQDPKGGGTETDGSLSSDYCSYCYEGGAFHDPDIKLPDFVAKMKGILGTMNVPSEVAEQSIAILPTLKRWRQPDVAS